MIAVIADDLTGAAEMAGLGWRHGLTAEILQCAEAPTAAELVVYNADSRNCSAAEAARRVAQIARQLRPHAPAWVYKKVDSVLRGNVLAEIRALQKEFRLERCLLVPANPAAQRIIKSGKYFVHGKPINQTDFRNDPTHPRRSADVKKMLGATAVLPVTLRRPKTDDLPLGVVIGEAATTADVQHWAQSVGEQTLAAGGADFFTALLEQHGLRPHKARRLLPAPRAGRTLFVSGSLAESSAQFLADCRARGGPVLLMPEELFTGRGSARRPQARWAQRIVEALKHHSQVAVGIGPCQRPGLGEGLRLGQILTATIRSALAKVSVDRVCVEGGATAALLVEQLNWKRLAVAGEFATGVTGVRPVAQAKLLLVLKPGSYAWPAGFSSGAVSGRGSAGQQKLAA